MNENTLLEVNNLTKLYTSGYIRTTEVVGAKDVSFNMERSEIFCLVGESGSGKTTVGNIILRLIKPTSGKILLDGKNAFLYEKKAYWRKVQAVFQDPYSSFNFFYNVDKPLNDAFDLLEKTSPKDERKKIIRSTLETIGMNPDEIMGRYPHQLSGGQMQRILIARSLIIHPNLLVADESTSMIDASTRVAVLNELLRLKEVEKMSVLFITHDLSQAYYIGDRIAIMKDGEIIEQGSVTDVIFHSKHPYTKNLVSSVPPIHEKWNL
jgi:peptide/nickel transport system ATP-binding protein